MVEEEPTAADWRQAVAEWMNVGELQCDFVAPDGAAPKWIENRAREIARERKA